MAERLPGDDRPVQVGDVRIRAPGLTGVVEVYTEAGGAGMRGAERATPEFSAALSATNMLEQLTVEIRDPVEVSAPSGGSSTRSTSRGEPGIEIEVPGPGSGRGQVLLEIDEDGVLGWHLPIDVLPVEVAARSGDRRTYVVPRAAVPHERGEARGFIAAVGVKLLKVMTFRLVDRVGGAVGDHFVRRWETARRPHRLRSFTPDDYSDPNSPDLTSAVLARMVGAPVLLFLHGTGSTTHSGFQKLPRWTVERLWNRYDGRIIAFNHPTFSVTPTDNIRELGSQLAELLPSGQHLTFDVVAHSRGGLVGRVLAERPAAAGVEQHHLDVRTLVFVGTPNAGTVLADPAHMGDFIDTFTNLLALVPDNPITGPLEVILTVVKQFSVGALRGLDGIASMDPRGTFLIDFLNTDGPYSSAAGEVTGHRTAYRAIAADFEPGKGAGLARFARNRLSDAVFAGAQNDLVVPTEGVYTLDGHHKFPLAATDVELFEAADSVDHSSYWARERTLAALDRWLTG